ncbi:hypothetical protein MPSI1_002814 [Malassezia psittaci]|uniref:Major facilitator superfamily (MFS) profile domain-containing protein n=1 Tax=Malassezia psittaci TaxID=1821823 RepID=A0AAF0F7K8_9BASI|nr:hypothetical protein MPSI1_002814 [Malassezia psittaci]
MATASSSEPNMATNMNPSFAPAEHSINGGMSDTKHEDSNIYNADYDMVTPEETVGRVYSAKAALLNQAVQDIGFGRYQIMLFLVIGFGWASDNLWPIATSVILPPVGREFHRTSRRTPMITLAQNIGLLAGAFFWGFGCDWFGRKWAFSLTLGFTSVFGLIAAGSPNFAAVGVFDALWSFGVGGNLPVDSAIFLEFLPATHQYLLTVLSTYWAIAQVFADLIAWGLVGNYTCQSSEGCTKGSNMGWRYFLITLGGLWMVLFIIRFFFPVLESPKYLMGKGRDEEAVQVVHRLARINGKTTNLTVEDLKKLEGNDSTGQMQTLTAKDAAKRSLQDFKFDSIRSLFRTRKMALSTGLTILIWALIGLAFPLYNAFIPTIISDKEATSTYITYRNLLIIGVLGVPACIIGAFLVEVKGIGRKGTLGISTVLTGVFLFCSTTTSTSTQLLGWQCAWSFTSSLMYASLYTYTPEIFPTKYRGTGNALTACANRIFGIVAPIIAMCANLDTPNPVYASGALFIVAGLVSFCLPLEPRGKASM